MNVRRTRALAVIAGLLWLGCGSDAPALVEVWADRACACPDAACAGHVRAEFTSWVEEQRSLRGSRSERARIEKAYGKIMLLKRRLAQKDLSGKW